MTNDLPKLGALHCATILCPSLERAARLYEQSLGFTITEQGTVSAARAKLWGAPNCAGAPYAVMEQPGQDGTFLRFIEDPSAEAPVPYRTLGWAALEFSVQSSDATIAALAGGGFDVIGPAQDLEFSKGALRAGQVCGPFGEILYLTQINNQIDDYTLPVASIPVDRMFIAINCVSDVDADYVRYADNFGMMPKEPFNAEVPFIAEFQNLPVETSYYVGCMELIPGHYIELDQMNADIAPRPYVEGALPGGIAMMTFKTPSLEPFRPLARGPSILDSGALYDGQESLLVTGPYGELIEVVETVVELGKIDA